VKVTLHVELNDYDIVALLRIAGMKGKSLDDIVKEAIINYINAESRSLVVNVPEAEKEASGSPKSEKK